MKKMLLASVVLCWSSYGDLDNAVRHLATLYPSGAVERVIIYTDADGVPNLHIPGAQRNDSAIYYELNRTASGAVSYQEKKQYAYTTADNKAALILKVLLEKHFGQGSHTNTAITEEYVNDYFVGKSLSGTSTLEDVQDALMMLPAFQKLSAITVDGTIWAFPWDEVP